MIATAFVLGLALSADAFAVSVSQGASGRGEAQRTALVLGGAFGLAQGIMPLIGWGVALLLSTQLAAAVFTAYDHWIAFAVLAAMGAKTLYEGMQQGPDAKPRSLKLWTVAALALATSIDAAAAGLAFAPMGLQPFSAAAIIGVVTALVCGGGVYMGRAAGAKLGPAAEVVGGAALILIGVKILWDHGALGLAG